QEKEGSATAPSALFCGPEKSVCPFFVLGGGRKWGLYRRVERRREKKREKRETKEERRGEKRGEKGREEERKERGKRSRGEGRKK
ncbi:hypothetical protein ACQJ1L_25050, partial [Klebsiella quasipneumoniae subsp. similipneumoniae]|uniref:hypothetical protein n=1 Tax=Klebsiella quasipneumoniae TaxID=1463165 RepID=UPI003CFFE016